MKELEYLELQEVPMQEIISYSKLSTSPVVTILDDLNYGLFNQLVAWVDLLKIPMFIIKDTYKVAIIGHQKLALNIAKRLQVKCQVMYNIPLKEKKILGKWHIPQRKSPYVIQAYNEYGRPIAPFIDTDIETTDCKILSKYKFTPFKYAMKIRGTGNNRIESYEELRRIRKEFLNEGKI